MVKRKGKKGKKAKVTTIGIASTLLTVNGVAQLFPRSFAVILAGDFRTDVLMRELVADMTSVNLQKVLSAGVPIGVALTLLGIIKSFIGSGAQPSIKVGRRRFALLG